MYLDFWFVYQEFWWWWFIYFGWQLNKPNIIFLMKCAGSGGLVAFIFDLFFVIRIIPLMRENIPILWKKVNLMIYGGNPVLVFEKKELIIDSNWEHIIVGYWCILMIYIVFTILAKYMYLYWLNFFVYFFFYVYYNNSKFYCLFYERIRYYFLILKKLNNVKKKKCW